MTKTIRPYIGGRPKKSADSYERKRLDKMAARKMLKYYIKRGVIQRQPCEVCGRVPAEGHHNDYTEPLNVKWLCKNHHWELHREIKAQRVLSKYLWYRPSPILNLLH